MWQALKTFFNIPVTKSRLTAIKVSQVGLAVTVITAWALSGCNSPTPPPNDLSNTAQHVIVFIGGLNTSMKNCYEDTFDDDSRSQIIAFLLSQAEGIANPYVKGCNGLDP